MKNTSFSILIIGVLSAFADAAIFNYTINHCKQNEFPCRDGTCISLDRVCDGFLSCEDGSDEQDCDGGVKLNILGESVITRSKRQSEKRCRRVQFRCRNGECVSNDKQCDGIVDCSDGSDESHALCRNIPCASYLFRCTYGACVDGDSKCDGKQDCADNSDELHQDCYKRNITGRCRRDQFECDNGQCVSLTSKCDGVADCNDRSDESVALCSATQCSELYFRCAYGACVDSGSDCDGKKDCADGSDEDHILCKRNTTAVITTATTSKPVTSSPNNNGGSNSANRCILPNYPAHGKYVVVGNPEAIPGQRLQTAFLNIKCDFGYGVTGDSNTTLYCFGINQWSEQIKNCERYCRLKKVPSISYKCLYENSLYSSRECKEWEPPGTVAVPMCNSPNYYSPQALPSMTCIEGSWDYSPTCIPECGRVSSSGDQLVISGWLAKRGEFPWHVGIFQKNTKPYMQICGGSIITTTAVISAAHCFWTDSEKLLPASRFAVAGGKLYRPWADQMDVDAQRTDVSDIKIPTLFRGSETNFQSDIAIVIVSTPFQYKTYVRPVCLDFDLRFSQSQLSPGTPGKIAGWGFTQADNDKSFSQILSTTALPVVTTDECLTSSPVAFREFITGDKFCAGYRNGTSLCKGDSGGGLVFPTVDRSVQRFFLRGIVSTAPRGEEFSICKKDAYTTFTNINYYEQFIRPYYSPL